MTNSDLPRVGALAVLVLSLVIFAAGAVSIAVVADGGHSTQLGTQETSGGIDEIGTSQIDSENGSDGSGTISSDFETGTDGWRITGDAQGEGKTPDYLASGGNPGGHICADDNVAGGTWYFSAPEKFLGDRGNAYGETLSFDIKQSSTDAQFAQDDIVLHNETRTIVYDFGNASTHPRTNWTAYTVALTASDANWTYDSGGDVSSEAFRTLLDNLTGLAIRGEYVDGSDRGCLDNVRLSEPTSTAVYDVALDVTNSPVREGETLTVDATVENSGEGRDSREVVLSINNTEVDSTEVFLEPGQSRTVSLSWATGDGDAGDYTATVASDDDASSREVVVTSPEFAVTLDAMNSPVREGEILTVDATVVNAGEAESSTTLVLSVDGMERDETEVALAPGESKTVELSWVTSKGDAGDYTATVRSGSDSDSRPVVVESEPASVTFEDQRVLDSSSQAVVVESVDMPSTGFLVVYNSSIEASPDSANIIAVSTLLGPYEYNHSRLFLNEQIGESGTLTVVVHNDSNGNDRWDGAEVDRPLTANGVVVNDTATIEVQGATEPTTGTATPTATVSQTPTKTPTDGTPEQETAGEDGPGFGMAITVGALLSVGLLARRTRR